MKDELDRLKTVVWQLLDELRKLYDQRIALLANTQQDSNESQP